MLIDEAIEKNKVTMEEMEKSRDALLGEMSNWLHPRYFFSDYKYSSEEFKVCINTIRGSKIKQN